MTTDARLTELAKQLRAAKDEKDELENQLKACNKVIQQLAEYDLPKLMDDLEIPSVRISGIGTLYLQQKVRASIVNDKKDEAYEWLSENGHGALIKEYVHPKSLEAWAKEQLENNMPIPECISTHKFNMAMIRRS